jgi:hypothetical protein
MPTPRTVAEIKSKLLRPALTSHFVVEVGFPGGGFNKFLQDNLGWSPARDQPKLNLMCSEATLPGSNLATLEVNNDFHGVTERHAYRRIYDDRIDLTFYVDAENYLPIRVFESWIKYVADESIADQENKGAGIEDPFYFYRMRYPDGNNGYTATGLKVIKFERDYRQRLEYRFIKSYPISLSSMPVAYDSSSLLKCTVSMTYIRYVLIPTSGKIKYDPSSPSVSSSGFGDPALNQAVERALDPLSGSGFSTPETEARFQRLANPQFNPGFADKSLNDAYTRLNSVPSDVKITDFNNF